MTTSILRYCLLTLLVACKNATAPESYTSPADAVFVTADIANFWRAVDGGGTSAAFQTEYLDKASAGLKDFIRVRGLTGTNLSATVRAFPRYYAAIRANTLALSPSTGVIAAIRANFAKIEGLYPAATFPPVTFLMGRFSTGGTTAASGMLIGSEFYAMDSNTPLDELGAFQRTNVRPQTALASIVAHEHGHILQENARALSAKSNKNLLEQSLQEGIADFIGELASGEVTTNRQRVFGLANERALWQEFQRDMRGTDVSRWLYNQGSATETPDRPGDLGYFIGYRIAQAYYTRATDKTRALAEIIELRDADAFLTASGYNP